MLRLGQVPDTVRTIPAGATLIATSCAAMPAAPLRDDNRNVNQPNAALRVREVRHRLESNRLSGARSTGPSQARSSPPSTKTLNPSILGVAKRCRPCIAGLLPGACTSPPAHSSRTPGMVEPLTTVRRNRVLTLVSRYSPCSRHRAAREAPRDRTFSPTDLAAFALMLKVAEERHPAPVAAIRLAAVTGIGWGHLDIESGRLTLPATKTGRRMHLSARGRARHPQRPATRQRLGPYNGP